MNALTGTVALTRLAVRRDRIVLPAWILGLAALLAAMTGMFVTGMPAQQDVIQEAQTMAGNPGIRMIGIASGASIGGCTLARGYTTLAILAALMSTLAVVRHTRQNEETGRAELVGATVVGRYASLTSALIVTVAANIALAASMALAMIVNGQPVAGSLTAGASFGAVGIVFAGVAAVTAQLSSTTRGANGSAGAAVGVAFLVAGIGNMLGNVDATGLRVVSAWPAWLSPIGWGQQMGAFDSDRWWPLGLFAVLFVVLVGAAGALARRRDLGRGVLPERRGHAEAARGMLSPFGLAWRLQRGLLLGWAIGMAGFGLVLGSIAGEVTDIQGTAVDWYRRLGATATDQFVDTWLAMLIEMAGMAAAIYMVQVLLRMRAEEAEGRLESMLATAVSRPRWVIGHVVNACIGATGLMLICAVSIALAAGQSIGDTPARLRELTGAALAQLPATLVIGGVVIAAVGMLSRWSGSIAWTMIIASVMFGPVFGATLGLPQWAQNLSPFTHVPKAPADAITAGPIVVLLLFFAALATAGLIATRRRNLALPA